MSHYMERMWFIGRERIPPSETEEPKFSSCSSTSRPCMTINLTEMLQADRPKTAKKPVPIRPPSPRVSQPQGQEFHRSVSCEPTPKPIIRQRSHSLPSATQKKKQLLMAAELTDGRHLEISLPYLKPVFAQQPGDQPGFLHRLLEQKVCLERVLCFELAVIGITQVLNMDFEKDVTVRYSFTEWKSCTETKASWVSTVTKTWEGGGGQISYDTFRFHLPVPPFLQPGAAVTVCHPVQSLWG
ncbi:Protein phosphatase 1 regulatory subunit 3D [Collichthys lucidus]|uniref:Protein phosphatase 1 regulatory subunit 3D n=1 Tax=Collichthys lucidus TaxID=240159 RepID=A0A4U5US99_COLLU|nr:Protein phosphatase 1 regulatory subunit 3D [Collichthys lucidus]